MFKCKACGRQFGANTPDQCPDCGAKNQQPEQSAKGLLILFTMDAIATLAFLIVVALVVVGILNLF